MRVVITGANRGIGRATALKLAADGAEALTLCDVAYLDELEALAVNLRTSGCTVHTLRADMARPNEPARVIASVVKAMGGISGIVGNAGITAPGKMVDFDVPTWDRLFEFNLRANWLLTKAALIMLTEVMAMEWASDRIRAISVCPGFVHTSMSGTIYSRPKLALARFVLLPLGRVARPGDIADDIAFLLSPGVSYITGQSLVADGGLTR